MRPGTLLAAAAVFFGTPAMALERVDLELVLGIDVSRSVDWEESMLQREGYISAFNNPVLLAAIKGGYYGRIAVTYVEWASRGSTRIVAPWMVISDEKSAADFNNILKYEPTGWGDRTSISGIIDLAASMFRANAYDGERRVIDISGDGPNNAGGLVTWSRDDAVAAGITINALPIINTNGGPGQAMQDLDVYFKECVIGGPGSFIVVAEGFEAFAEAITRKLILEVAGLEPHNGIERIAPASVQRAQFLSPRQAAPSVDGPRYAPACDIGERRPGGGMTPAGVVPLLPQR